MMESPSSLRRNGDREGPPKGGLTPSDQLLAIFVVNLILVAWVAASFSGFYDAPRPHLPGWMFWVEGLVLGSAILLASWPRLRGIAEGRGDGDPPPPEVNLYVLKGAVFVLTALDVLILWRLAEETGGVLSPYAPFLPAPAIFASFVTKKWETIVGLSIAVAISIALSSFRVPNPFPEVEVYQGSAAVLVILAGTLNALQARVASTGQPITGRGSLVIRDEIKPLIDPLKKLDDDDDFASSTKP
jgi:hypothetical protein